MSSIVDAELLLAFQCLTNVAFFYLDKFGCAEVSSLVFLHPREWRWHAKGVLIVEVVLITSSFVFLVALVSRN